MSEQLKPERKQLLWRQKRYLDGLAILPPSTRCPLPSIKERFLDLSVQMGLARAG